MAENVVIVVSGSGGNIGSNMVAALDGIEEFQLIGTESNKYNLAHSDASDTYILPHAGSEPSTYLSRLKNLLKQLDADVFLPSNIMEIVAIAGVNLPVNTFLPKSQTISLFANKWKSYTAWKRAGVPIPETHKLSKPSDLFAAKREIPSQRLWVRGGGMKQTISVAGRTFDNLDDIRCWVDYHDGWGEFLASEYLPGKDCTWLGVFEHGELLCSQGRERIDYGESAVWGTGAPTISKTITSDDVNRIGRQAVEAVVEQPHGTFFTDMRADTSGELRVTEVNPGRLGTSSSGFYYRLGFNVAQIMCHLALGWETPEYPIENVLSEGIYYLQKLASEPKLVDERNLAI
jgi:carbamoyl-phosphate synthase large subunit